MKNSRIFSEVQEARLRNALEFAQHVGFEGSQGGFMSPHDVVDVLLRYMMSRRASRLALWSQGDTL